MREFNAYEYLMQENQPKKKWFIQEKNLDKEQMEILNGKDNNYVIEGCAGSGKTILALHRLIRILDESRETALFVVYTRALKDFVKDGVKALFKKGNNNFKISYVEKIIADINNKKIGCYDYVIVDEVQDIGEDRLEKILNLYKKGFLLFGDDKQQVFEDFNEGITIQYIKNEILGRISKKNKVLKKNYRTPKEIAKFAGIVVNDNGALLRSCQKEDGKRPILTVYNSMEDEVKEIMDIIKNESLTDVGILYPNIDCLKKEKNMFQDLDKNFLIEYKAENAKDDTLNFNTDLPKLIPYHSSKGLEFEHVFLPSCNLIYSLEKNNFREAFYVACTRARTALYISYIKELKFPIKSIINEYKRKYNI